MYTVGTTVMSTYAGAGIGSAMNNGGLQSSLNLPCNLTVDINGNIYVADTLNNQIKKIDVYGNVSIWCCKWGGHHFSIQ